MTHFDETQGPDAAPDQDERDKPVKNPHDAAFKSAFKRIVLARGFFKNFLPEHLSRRIDLDHLKLKPGSYTEGRTELLIKQLKKRFGPPPRSIVERLERSNREMLDLFGESLLDFKDLRDAERWWNEH